MMNEEKKISQLQQQVDELSTEIKGYREQLTAMQQHLEKLQQDIIATPITKNPHRQTQNFRLENFIGLRIIHLVGIIVFVIGLSIGVKYALDRQLISEAARIILAFSAGVVLNVLSWKLKKKYLLFSAILFSGAMASGYFTTYAAFAYYSFFSFGASFLLMVGLTIFTCYQSIKYDRQEIAVLGMVGAYGIPFLISANADKPGLFFSYIFLINLGVLFLSFRKKWKVMGQLALVITWTLLLLWSLVRYEPKDLWIGFIAMIVFYLLFIVNAFAYRLIRNEPVTTGDIQRVALNNIALYFSALSIAGYGNISAQLAGTTGFVAAWLAVFSLLCYALLRREIILQQSLAAQSVSALVLFIGFYWSGFLVTIFWLVLAILLFTWGMFTRRSWPRLAAILLMAVTLAKLVIFDSSKFTAVQKVVAYLAIGTLLLLLSFFYQKFRQGIFDNREADQ